MQDDTGGVINKEKDISAWQLTSSSLSLISFLVIFVEYFRNSSVLVWSTGRTSRNLDFRKSLKDVILMVY